MNGANKQSITINPLRVQDTNELEYEIKLECLDKSKGLFDILDAVERALDANPHYLVDAVQTASQMVSHFLVDASNTEYSAFRYEGKVMLKIKKHDILHGREFPIFKNSEQFVYDLGEITTKLSDERIIYVGSMLKRRIKDFMIDDRDGRVYSVAITICEASGQKQHQLEVEYYGYMKGSPAETANDETDLLNKLTEICSYIKTACAGQFAASVERKYEFVLKHGAVAHSDADHKKAHLLKTLEKI